MGGKGDTRPVAPIESHVYRGRLVRRERELSALAARQHGVVTSVQLRSLGLTSREIERRLDHHRLRRVHRGVYLVGAVAPPRAREMAAVLACGTGAVLSHVGAAVVLGILRPPRRPGRLDVTVRSNRRPRPGIRIHRVKDLDRRDVRVRDRIPLTAPARTLLDLATELHDAQLEQALAEAQVARLVRRADLDSVLDRYPSHRGRGTLRGLLDASPTVTRSQAERQLLELIRRARLPAPETQVPIGPYEVDFLWRGDGVVVEVDGFRFHSSRAAFERDRDRDADLQGRGYRVVRITWRQIAREPEATAVRLGRLLEPERS